MRAAIRKVLAPRLATPPRQRRKYQKCGRAHSLKAGYRVFLPPFKALLGTVVAVDDLVARVKWDDGIETLATARRLLRAADVELARCDQEIAEILSHSEGKPAWLVTLGIEDWEAEKRLIEKEAAQ